VSSRSSTSRRVASAVLASLATATITVGPAHADEGTAQRSTALTRPRTITMPARSLDQSRFAAATPAPALPTFAHAFRYGTKTYTYAMVGTDPLGPAATTTIGSDLVPIAFRINGETIVPSDSVVTAVKASGLFHPRTFPGGNGQYADTFMRTQFWSWLQVKRGVVKNWHVNLANPITRPTLTLNVPADKGTVRVVKGVRVAVVDVDWFVAQAGVQAAVTAPSASRLTQLLAGSAVLCQPYSSTLAGCGIGGFHSLTHTTTGNHTYTFQDYLNPAVFGVKTGFTDLGPMSHELAEWMADPYLNNQVPGWTSPLAPQYGCVDALEPADPVVTSQITVGGQHYSDEAYLWWFAHSPSRGWMGRYTWFNSLTLLPRTCTPPPPA
jgi:hypothetical protein